MPPPDVIAIFGPTGIGKTDVALALGEALRRMVQRYRSDPAPVTFRVLVSPLVTWIWLGALIIFGGGLITIWPAPASIRQRVGATYAARLGRELGRA